MIEALILAGAQALITGALNELGARAVRELLPESNQPVGTTIINNLYVAQESIAAIVHEEFQRQKLQDAIADIQALQATLDAYITSPNDDLLSDATARATSITANLAYERMGLQGYSSFFAGFGLRILVLQERIKKYGDKEREVLANVIMNEGIPMAEKYRDEMEKSYQNASPSSIPRYNTMLSEGVEITTKWEDLGIISMGDRSYDYYFGDVSNHRGNFYGIKNNHVVYLGSRKWNRTPPGTTRLGTDFHGNGFWFCVKSNLADKKYYVHDVRNHTAHTYLVQKGLPGNRAALICSGVYGWGQGPGTQIALVFHSNGCWIKVDE